MTTAGTSGGESEKMPPDERDDETQALNPQDDATRAMRPDDDPTRLIGQMGEPTRRMDVSSEPLPTQQMRPEYVHHAPSTERIRVPPRSNGFAPWLVALVVVLALAGGAVAGYAQRGPSDANVVARALVGPQGGVMTFDGAGELTVPAEALPTATAITIRRVTIQHRVRLGAEGDPRSVSYEPGELVVYAFEPAELRFQQPVTILLPKTGDGSAVFVDSRGSPRVVPGTDEGDTVKIETTTFTFDPPSASGVGG